MNKDENKATTSNAKEEVSNDLAQGNQAARQETQPYDALDTRPAPNDTAAEDEFEFGIDETTESGRAVSIQPPVEVMDNEGTSKGIYDFPVCTLTDVTVEDVVIKKGADKGKSILALCFHFKEENSVRVHKERILEFNPKDMDKSENTKISVFNTKVKHIWEAFGQFPNKKGIGKGAKSLRAFFEAIATAFNTSGPEGTPIYTGKRFWLKVLFYKGFVQLPYSPNFIQGITPGAKCTLAVSPKDQIKQKSTPTLTADNGGYVPAVGATPAGGFPPFQ